MAEKALRVCYFGTYRDNYSRNQIMIEGLRQNGVEVIECHESLWRGIEDRVQVASRGWLRPAFALRLVRAYWNLLRAHRKVTDYDVMVLGYPGQLDTYLARVLTRLRRRPLVLDQFMSLYLIALERGLVSRHPFSGRLIHLVERGAYSLPDLVIQDTAEYVEWSRDTYGLVPDRVRLVPTGADDRVFHPVAPSGRQDGVFRVLYYGTFIPNHGVRTIIEAANLLRDQADIQFEMIGEGPEKAEALALAQEAELEQVHFVGWVDKGDLPRRVADADLCLGAFGTTPQSIMTVQNKIYEGLALQKCVLTGDASTVRNTLTHGEQVWLCERANPESLAEAILTLKRDPALRARLAESGYQVYREMFTIAALGKRFRAHLIELVADS